MKDISDDELEAIRKKIDGIRFTYEYWNSYTQLPIEIEKLEVCFEKKRIIGKLLTQNFGPGGNYTVPTEERENLELKIIAEKDSEIKMEIVNVSKIIFLDVVKLEMNYNSKLF